MRGSFTINPRGRNTSINSGGVGNYLDLPDRPDELIEEPTVPAVTAGGEFVPSNDNSNKAAVSITDGGSTITTTRTNNCILVLIPTCLLRRTFQQLWLSMD
jgi:hypothetical protein